MSAASQKQSVRRLSASSLARRERRLTARRRRNLLGAVGAFAFILTAPLSIGALMGVDPAIAGLDAAKSFLRIMTDRSPGKRTAAELIKTKKKAAPHQRALAKIAKPAAPPEFEEAIAPPAPMLAELPPFAPTLAGLAPLLQTPPIVGGGPPIVPSSPPGGGGGTPPENPPENPPPPVVPEPGTWATMLLGFGMIGWLMRRRRRRGDSLHWA